MNLHSIIIFLTEQNITLDVLKILKPNHIEKLTLNYTIGHQAIFETNLEKWRNQQQLDGHNSFPNLKPSETNHHVISVKEILSNTYNGKEILNFYGKNNILHEEQRSLLISTITKYIEAKGIDCSISDCSQIENDICLIFPTEQIVSCKIIYKKYLNKDVFIFPLIFYNYPIGVLHKRKTRQNLQQTFLFKKNFKRNFEERRRHIASR